MKKILVLLALSPACFGQSVDNMMTVPSTPSWETVNRQPAPKSGPYRETQSDESRRQAGDAEHTAERKTPTQRPGASKGAHFYGR